MLTEQQDTASVVAAANLFVVTRFVGPGQNIRVERTTLAEARATAREVYKYCGPDRPVGIYAISDGRDVHIENYPA
jgi:hypothetical protein